MSDEILTSYSGVKLSQDEYKSLNDEILEPVSAEQELKGEENQPQEDEVLADQSEPLNESQETFEVLELDGQEYEMDTIKEALEAYENKTDWQKSNTEKAQEVSAEKKLWTGLRNNEDAIAALKDVLDEDHPIFNTEEVVAEEEPDQDTNDSSRIQELEERLNELTRVKEQELLDIEADRQVTADLTQLKQGHPELQDPQFLDSVIKTAVEKGFTGIQGLEDAFALTYHSSAENSAFKSAVNRARNAKAMKSIPEPKGSARGLHSEPNEVPKSYKDAQADALKNYNFYE
tara:strand:+ start:8782 stop:9648 length:867 start_codon:yes stop_codon:yes gene_type:complete